MHNVRRDGTPFWCRATASRFEHPEHGIVYRVVQEDINNRRLIEQMKDELISVGLLNPGFYQ